MDAALRKSKKRLWILAGLLLLQVPVWIVLVLGVPVLSKKYAYPAFSVHPKHNCACMVLRLSGSHVWGLPVSDVFCVHFDSGRLSRFSNEDLAAMQKRERAMRCQRSMHLTSDGSVEIGRYDPASANQPDVQPIDFPKRKGPAFINERYVLGADESHVYLWDAEKPEAGTRVLPPPLTSISFFDPIADTDLAYHLLQAKPIDAARGSAAKTGESEEAGSTRVPSSSGDADPFGDSDPFGGSDTIDDADPFGSARKSLFARSLRLFRIDETTGPEFVAQWDLLVPDRHSFSYFSSSVVTRVDRRLVSLSPTADEFEYRSIDTGELIDRRPLPDGFDVRTMEWAFDHGRIHLGSRSSGPLFDLASGNWLPNPGQAWELFREYLDHELAVYRQRSDERYVVFDHRRGERLLHVEKGQGIPFLLDGETVAICSTRCGFGVDIVDLRDGRTLASWTPWWWAKWLLFASLAAYLFWSIAWIRTAAEVHRFPWLDAMIVLGMIVAVFAFRYKWTGTPGIDEVAIEQVIRGISCAVLTISCCGLLVGRGSVLSRFVVFCFALSGVIAVSRLLLDTTYEDVNAEGARVMMPTYYETVQWLCYVLISLFTGVLLCLVVLACGFRVRDNRAPSANKDNPMTWRIADLCLLIAATASLITVSSVLLPHARYEATELYANNYDYEPWQMLVAIGPLTLAVAIATLATRGSWFWLSSLVAVMAVFAVGWEPISEFVLKTPAFQFTPRPDHQRVAASSLAAAYVIGVPYRLRGWRIRHRRALAP